MLSFPTIPFFSFTERHPCKNLKTLHHTISSRATKKPKKKKKNPIPQNQNPTTLSSLPPPLLKTSYKKFHKHIHPSTQAIQKKKRKQEEKKTDQKNKPHRKEQKRRDKTNLDKTKNPCLQALAELQN